jgi:anti-sigma B factor antagonist
MKVSVDQPKQNIQRIVLDGRLDIAGTQAAEAQFNAVVAVGPNVIVDLGKVSFISSLGIRLLVAGAQTRSKLGGKMVLMNPDDTTRKILKTTGIDQIVPIFGNLDEAMASIYLKHMP